MMKQQNNAIRLFNLNQNHNLDLDGYMSNSENDEIENLEISGHSEYDLEGCYDLTSTEISYPSDLAIHSEKTVIDCTVLPSISLEEVVQDIADYELSDVDDLKKNFEDYNDVAYWAAALINQSPTGALLLKNAVFYDWAVAFEDIEETGWALNTDQYIASLNKAQIHLESLSRSPFFMNTIVCDLIRALRDIWLEEKNEIDYADHHPETLLKIERLRAADIESLTLQVAWELRSAGYTTLWRHILGSNTGDMAMLFSRYLEKDPASLFDGSALLIAFKQWYMDEDRVNTVDRVALEMCDDILLASNEQKNVFALQPVDQELLADYFSLPEGRVYIAAALQEIMKSPHYASMHDSINETHLYHILRDMEVCYVGDVPFRDQSLADKIFPDYTKILK